MPCTEAEAIQLCREAAFKVHRKVRKYFALEDLEQEAWVALVKLIPKWNKERSNFRTYVRNVLPLRLLDFLRDQSFAPRLTLEKAKRGECQLRHTQSLDALSRHNEQLAKVVSAPCKELNRLELNDELIKLTRHLSAETKEVIKLMYFNDLRQCEIAERMRLSPSRISQLHTAGLRILRARKG